MGPFNRISLKGAQSPAATQQQVVISLPVPQLLLGSALLGDFPGAPPIAGVASLAWIVIHSWCSLAEEQGCQQWALLDLLPQVTPVHLSPSMFQLTISMCKMGI